MDVEDARRVLEEEARKKAEERFLKARQHMREMWLEASKLEFGTPECWIAWSRVAGRARTIANVASDELERRRPRR